MLSRPRSCYAKSASGPQSLPCSFLVTVVDIQFPVIACPAPIVVNATSPAGAVVTYAPTASDNCGSVTVVSTPASGAVFPIGDTTVHCTASDTSLNEASCAFNVHVKGAAEQTSDLLAKFKAMKISISGVKKALLNDLTLVLSSLQSNNTLSACGSLQAFIDLVNAQRGISISSGDADYLVSEATRIRAVIGC